jgi:hypothetical protein
VGVEKLELKITRNPEMWYVVGALWGDPYFCVSKGIHYVGIYGEKEFCEHFVQSLFQVYGVNGHVYFNRGTGCHAGIVAGKSVRIKKAYQDLNRFGPYSVDLWRVPDILHDEKKFVK